MNGPGLVRILPGSVLAHAATALVIAQAEIDVLKDQLAERDEIIRELQSMLFRALYGTERET